MVKWTDWQENEQPDGSIGGLGDGSELQPTFVPLLEPKPEPIVKLTYGETLIQESVNKSLTGTLIKATVEGLQLELGFSTMIGTVDWKIVKEYLTPSW